MRSYIVFAAMFVSVPQAFAAIRTHATLQSCMVTIGDFCPIESIGFSLLGTAIIALVIFGAGLLFQILKGIGKPALQYDNTARLDVLGATANSEASPSSERLIARFGTVLELIKRGEYIGAFQELEAHLGKGDAEAESLLRQISMLSGDRATRSTTAAQLMKNQEFGTAFRYLIDLAREGDTAAQYTVGLMYQKGIGIPQNKVEALKWLFLAAHHKDDRAYNALADEIPGLSESVKAEVEAFIGSWRPAEAKPSAQSG